jgi:hypothetical protein
MTIADPDDGTGRLFIADKIGIVWVRERNGTVLSAPLVDVSGEMVRLNPAYDERGLLGFALHLDFKENSFSFITAPPLRKVAPTGWSHTNRRHRGAAYGHRAEPHQSSRKGAPHRRG